MIFLHQLLTLLLEGRNTEMFSSLNRSTHASPGGHGVDNNDGTLTPELQEEYIDLMCQVNPTQVYAYLKGAEGYRLEQTLEASNGLSLHIFECSCYCRIWYEFNYFSKV